MNKNPYQSLHNFDNKSNNSFKQKTNVNNQINNTSNKQVNFFDTLSERLKARQQFNKKHLPVNLSLLFGMITVIISIAFGLGMGDNFIKYDNMLYIRTLLYSIVAFPILYLIFWTIIKNIAKLFLEESLVKEIHIVIIITLLLTTLFGNLGLIKFLNSSLDSSKPVKKYFRLEKKFIEVVNTKKNHTYEKHYIYFNSWIDDSLFAIEVSPFTYKDANVGDIYKGTIHKGYYGYEYYTDFNFYKAGYQCPFSKEL